MGQGEDEDVDYETMSEEDISDDDDQEMKE